MRTIRYLFLAALAVVLVTVALANREPVTLALLPSELGRVVGVDFSVSLPLYVVIFGAIVAGLLIGFFWEWMREHKHRAAARDNHLAKQRLSREVKRLKTDKAKSEGDEVLALLDN
ncbi:LapA family protein [Celeribacter arenosi]|uniref:LapA family protein n=1 Tax=Celeribacter arenosi TaxID=792649 RepID=A0ABP7K705_9RHOB